MANQKDQRMLGMTPFLDTIQEYSILIASVGAALAVIFAPPSRRLFKKAKAAMLNVLLSPIHELQRDVRRVLAEREETECRIESIADRFERVEYALLNNGKTGVLNHVSRLVARDNAEFERADYPGFDCSQTGDNHRVTAAYRKLIGVTSREDLRGGLWRQAIYGELKDSYLEEFKRSTDSAEDFTAAVDFRNPRTHEHRGRWLIHAPAAPVTEGILYSGRFIAALDKTAVEIASAYAWDVEDHTAEPLIPGDPDSPYPNVKKLASWRKALLDKAAEMG